MWKKYHCLLLFFFTINLCICMKEEEQKKAMEKIIKEKKSGGRGEKSSSTGKAGKKTVSTADLSRIVGQGSGTPTSGHPVSSADLSRIVGQEDSGIPTPGHAVSSADLSRVIAQQTSGTPTSGHPRTSADLARILEQTSASSPTGNVSSGELLSRLSPDETNPTLQQLYEELQQTGMKCDDDDGAQFPIVKQRTRRTATYFISNDIHWECVGRINKSAKPPKELYEKYHLKYANTRPDRFILKCQTDNCPHSLLIFRDDGRVYANEMHNHPIKKLLTEQPRHTGHAVSSADLSRIVGLQVPGTPTPGHAVSSADLSRIIEQEGYGTSTTGQKKSRGDAGKSSSKGKGSKKTVSTADLSRIVGQGSGIPTPGHAVSSADLSRIVGQEASGTPTSGHPRTSADLSRIVGQTSASLPTGNVSSGELLSRLSPDETNPTLQQLYEELQQTGMKCDDDDGAQFPIVKQRTSRTATYFFNGEIHWECVGRITKSAKPPKELYEKYRLKYLNTKPDRFILKCQTDNCPHRLYIFKDDGRVYANEMHNHTIKKLLTEQPRHTGYAVSSADLSRIVGQQSSGTPIPGHAVSSTNLSRIISQQESGTPIPGHAVSSADLSRIVGQEASGTPIPGHAVSSSDLSRIVGQQGSGSPTPGHAVSSADLSRIIAKQGSGIPIPGHEQSKERGGINQKKDVTAGTFKVPAPVKRKSKSIAESAAAEQTLPLETEDESKRPRNAEYYTDQYGIRWPRIGQITYTRENLKKYCREKELVTNKRSDERARVICRIKSCPYVELIFGNDGYIYSNQKHIHPVIESKGELGLEYLFGDLEKDDEDFIIKKTEYTERTSKYYEGMNKAIWQCVGKLINTPQGRKEFYKRHGLQLGSRKRDHVEFKCKIPNCPHKILLFANDPRVYCNTGHIHLIDDEMSPPTSPFPDFDFEPAESSVAAFGQRAGPYYAQGSPSIQSVDRLRSLFETMSPPETPQSKPTDDQEERGQIPGSPISSAFWADYELEEGKISMEPTPQSSPRHKGHVVSSADLSRIIGQQASGTPTPGQKKIRGRGGKSSSTGKASKKTVSSADLSRIIGQEGSGTPTTGHAVSSADLSRIVGQEGSGTPTTGHVVKNKRKNVGHEFDGVQQPRGKVDKGKSPMAVEMDHEKKKSIWEEIGTEFQLEYGKMHGTPQRHPLAPSMDTFSNHEYLMNIDAGKIDVQTRTFALYDSLVNPETEEAKKKFQRMICEFLRKLYAIRNVTHVRFDGEPAPVWINFESDSMKKHWAPPAPQQFPTPLGWVPQQGNTIDCGVFLMRFMRNIVEQGRLFGVQFDATQEMCYQYRREIFNQIFNFTSGHGTSDIQTPGHVVSSADLSRIVGQQGSGSQTPEHLVTSADLSRIVGHQVSGTSTPGHAVSSADLSRIIGEQSSGTQTRGKEIKPQIPGSPLSSTFWANYELDEGKISLGQETPQSSPRHTGHAVSSADLSRIIAQQASGSPTPGRAVSSADLTSIIAQQSSGAIRPRGGAPPSYTVPQSRARSSGDDQVLESRSARPRLMGRAESLPPLSSSRTHAEDSSGAHSPSSRSPSITRAKNEKGTKKDESS